MDTRPVSWVYAKSAVPTPKMGNEPETPMTSIAHARREIKASAQEHRLCPAPESTWNTTFHVDCSQDTHETRVVISRVSAVRGGHRQLFSTAGTAKATWARMVDLELGPTALEPDAGEGYTILFVAASYRAVPPVRNERDGCFPAIHSW